MKTRNDQFLNDQMQMPHFYTQNLQNTKVNKLKKVSNKIDINENTIANLKSFKSFKSNSSPKSSSIIILDKNKKHEAESENLDSKLPNEKIQKLEKNLILNTVIYNRSIANIVEGQLSKKYLKLEKEKKYVANTTNLNNEVKKHHKIPIMKQSMKLFPELIKEKLKILSNPVKKFEQVIPLNPIKKEFNKSPTKLILSESKKNNISKAEIFRNKLEDSSNANKLTYSDFSKEIAKIPLLKIQKIRKLSNQGLSEKTTNKYQSCNLDNLQNKNTDKLLMADTCPIKRKLLLDENCVEIFNLNSDNENEEFNNEKKIQINNSESLNNDSKQIERNNSISNVELEKKENANIDKLENFKDYKVCIKKDRSVVNERSNNSLFIKDLKSDVINNQNKKKKKKLSGFFCCF